MIGVIKGTMRQKKSVNGLPLPIAAYKTNVKGNLKSLKVAINATQSGSGTPAPDNIRPIIGASECNVVRCGKNLFSYDFTIRDGYWTNNAFVGTNAIVPKENAMTWQYIRVYVEGLSSITLSGFDNQGGTLCAWLSSENVNDVISRFNSLNKNGTKTVPSGAKYLCLTMFNIKDKSTTYPNAQLEVGTTATAYEPYNGNTYTIQLGDTYYGGSLDVTTGVLTVTWKSADLSTFEYTKSPSGLFLTISLARSIKIIDSGSVASPYIKSSHFNVIDSTSITGPQGATPSPNGTMAENTGGHLYFNYTDVTSVDDFKNAMQGVNFIYELATPITIQLTPTQVEQLLGTNNVWADTGGVEELIYTDRQVYYGK